MSWIQLQLIEPGAKASTSYAGTTWVIAFLVGTTALIGTIGYVRRRREERQPFELPEPASDGSPGQVKPVLKKIAVALGTLVFVLVFNFFLFRIAGNPKNDLIRGNPRLSEAGRERLIHQRGLDQGYVTQFRIYIDDTLHGDFGTSFQTNQPVSTMMWAALPNTLILVGISTLLATIIGSWLGICRPPTAGRPATPAWCSRRCSSTRCRTSGRAWS